MTERGIVAAGHRRTAEAAEEILLAGGNAFDAALAGMCAACAAEPMLCSLGGGGFLVGRRGREAPIAYDFFVQTPMQRPVGESDFREVSVNFGTVTQSFHIGLGAIATPGVVRGLFEVHRDLGSMPIREIVAPAIEIAKNGVEVCDFLDYVFRVVEPIFMASEASRAIYSSPKDSQRLIGSGERLFQPDLAETLDALAHEGDDLFYRGEIAAAIDRQSREGGGCLRREDLEAYRVERRNPLSVRYRDAEIWTNPPPTSGGLLIVFALKLLAAVKNPQQFDFGSAEQLKLMAHVLRSSSRARIEATLADSSYIDQAALFGPELLERYRTEVRDRAEVLRGTTSLSVIDAQENVVSLTLSSGEGCGEIVPGTGLMLNNMLGEDDLVPQGFHRWPMNERMTSMMAPTFMHFRDGRTVATGSGGSKRIRTAVLHTLMNLIDYGSSVEEAVTRPRIFMDHDFLHVEGGFATPEVEQLVADYRDYQVWDDLNLFFGGAHTVERRGIHFEGAGDPRRRGACRIARSGG